MRTGIFEQVLKNLIADQKRSKIKKLIFQSMIGIFKSPNRSSCWLVRMVDEARQVREAEVTEETKDWHSQKHKQLEFPALDHQPPFSSLYKNYKG